MKSRIQKYIEGELSNAEQNALEKEALNDPFLADALEGLSESNTVDGLNALNSEFASKHGLGTISWRGKLAFAIGIFAIAGAALVYYNIQTNDDPIAEENSPNKEEKLELQKDESTSTINVLNQDSLENEEIIKSKIKQDEVLVLKESDIPEDKYELEEDQLEVMPFIDIEPISPIVTDVVSTDDNDKQSKLIIASNMDLEYYYHLKVVDYSNIYRKSIRTDKSLGQGTPAFMENQGTNNGVHIDFEEEVWVPYMEYLEESMEHVSKGRNKIAIQHFEVIFDHFPNDANAQFYAGLCKFYLKKYDEAINHFDDVVVNNINTFHEEADWHRLLCYKATEQKTLFDMLRKKIIDSGGFYAERASGLTY